MTSHPLLLDDELEAGSLPVRPEEDHAGDGYDWASELPPGWRPVYSWGTEGWELGEPPYQVIAHFDDTLGAPHGLARYVEGDVFVTAYRSREARDAATDELALGVWLWAGNGPAEGLPAEGAPAARIPDRFRGPYRPEATTATC
ncbi:hypothetical protein [Streptomyces anulatus]|uniref:hypothetical protein n=1 Tax=Streptomyces anulatus TaxID=1892 RepID=UPI001C252E93|nr:hypothetical protein [Streptomyces anulatus]